MGEQVKAVRSAHTWRLALMVAAVAALSGCGGGGSGTTSTTGTSTLPPSSTLAAKCVAPRTTGGYSDKAGTVDDEKAWVRSWIDETYLWYSEVPKLDATAYVTPVDYFNALKTPAITASGKPKDQFHFTYSTADWVALSTAGVQLGYGFEVALLAAKPPRKALIAYTNPGTPASAANITRGAEILAVDGVDLINDGTQVGVDALNAGLYPTTAGTHTFNIRDLGSSITRVVTLTAMSITSTPVQNVKTLPAPNQNVGYLQFNDHIATSEQELVDAITQLKAAGVSDLVLDIRYNGGGYLDIASELAYMIAGPAATNGKVFERLNFNDKNPFGFTAAQTTTTFHTTTLGFSGPAGQSLPTLGLNRVYVLTGPNTCSASESIINSLRGVNVQAVLVGGTTCGKPYGFYPADNCGTTYFSIQFQGVNDKGFGDYADGFGPTCQVSDDFNHVLGDPAEGQLAVALGYRNAGTCTAVAQGIKAQSVPANQGLPQLWRSPMRENRIYRTH